MLLTAAGLLLLAGVLIWPVQRAMVRRHIFRREPLLSLLVWKAVSLTAVLSLLAVGPLTFFLLRGSLDRPGPFALAGGALVVTALMVLRLGLSAHTVGMSLRRTRRQHLELLELVGAQFAQLELPTSRRLRVIDHPTPTAYCVPGVRNRVVVSTGMLATLGNEEVAAVLAHERAHVKHRHDLLVEFFTVLHNAMPPRLRQEDTLAEVRLLAEVLADRAAARVVGPVAMGRALVALAHAPHPPATLAAAPAAGAARVRISLLTQAGERDWFMVGVMTAYAVFILALPFALVGSVAGY
ncbi:MAG: M56 family metallopeptidase [Actinomycetia bacterium]|nr:M56 family metallopeptidase [Actinomycetes bacterium]